MRVGAEFETEGALQTAAIKILEEAGAFVENRVPSYFGDRGVPDITGTLRGYSFAIEAKNPKMYGPPKETDKRWPRQRSYLRKLSAAGGYALATNLLQPVFDLIAKINGHGFYVEEWREPRCRRRKGTISPNKPCVP